MKRTILFLMVLLASVPAAANPFSGRVIGVMDGDTILVLTSGYEQMKVRLAEIDAPEKVQPFGERSKQALSALCFNKLAYVEVVDIDRYKRIVGKVSCEGIDANRSQVENGMAWVYRRYAKDLSLLPIEGMAKTGRRGLWADADPTPPWEWRKNK